MGAAVLPRIQLITTLSEVAGYKSGLALTTKQIIEHLPDHAGYLAGPENQIIRIRSEDYEDIFVDLLHKLGVIESPRQTLLGKGFRDRYKADTKKFDLADKIIKIFLVEMPKATAKAGKDKIDLTPFVEECARQHGKDGLDLGLAFVDDVMGSLQSSPWSNFRRVDWTDTAQLKDLFESEGLTTLYGRFFDQRYIDYLGQNFDEIDKINWRKFEGLTAEFFEREGFRAEIGPGRDDGNIDVRVWPKDAADGRPPTIIIQCKREASKIGKVVVKALYADLLHERAESGLIVTTRSLAPGAAEVCTARGYPITQADRAAVKKWVENMRTPLTGVFLGA
ncbi:MAG: restriction endonuclease [Elusimicrobiota bacterium]|nr:restriction endonuclease [Elusimicrobiota bacterium]